MGREGMAGLFDPMEEILQGGKAEMISMCRPLIREPRLVSVWKDGVMKRADCISCNKCVTQLYIGETRCHQI